jgi:hypothetical protein
MMPTFASPGVMTPGQFGPMRRLSRPFEEALHAHHVLDGNPFRDADDEPDTRRPPASMIASAAPGGGT